MLRINDLKLPLDHADDALRAALLARLGIDDADLLGFTVFKRSYDARKRSAIVLIYSVDAEVGDQAALLARLAHDAHVIPSPDTGYQFVAGGEQLQGHDRNERPVVIGTGPCGLFAALILAQMGLRPLILERGKVVRERTVDTFGFWRKRELNPESNVQFGEGGAGTFSDGKLYSQIKDPKHYGRKVLTEFVKAGAPREILYVAKPHIGTFRLVGMVEAMRRDIEALGGEIRFQQRVTDLRIDDGHVRGLVLASGEELRCEHVVLALGHSARDTFEMLHARGVFMEPKPFSIGFRIEHPQSLIDRARFGPNAGHPLLGAADYKLVHHATNGRSVYSFCMCPGGTVVAATSEPNRVVTNGMSQYSRNERNANAGIVVGITPDDYPGGPLAGVELQRRWESRAFELGGGTYEAPAQLVGDFIAGKPSTALGSVEPSYKPGVKLGVLSTSLPEYAIAAIRVALPAFELGGGTYDAPAQLVGDFIAGKQSTALCSVEPSYKPGVKLGDLATSLPGYAIAAIREALPAFERQIRGFSMADAVLTGVETRTSSPLRITRGGDCQSLNVKGLYPAGEGAGYAGGILSAGVDGIRIAEALATALLGEPPTGVAAAKLSGAALTPR
jgi:uncharacterized FAD-dependent dehydrogenase